LQAIGKIAGSAHQEIDVAGLIVAPGFIDVHTHAEDVDDQPLAENFLRMGVTTLVLGNCGSSALNIGEYFTQLETITTSPNIATLVGLGTVRRRAMNGSFDRLPTAEELEKMKALVQRGMEDGAVGVSTGLIYLPGVFAKTEEIIELAKVAAPYDGIYATHQRSESGEIFSRSTKSSELLARRTFAPRFRISSCRVLPRGAKPTRSSPRSNVRAPRGSTSRRINTLTPRPVPGLASSSPMR
jgi:N-acyl-D-amino-acid deacylase